MQRSDDILFLYPLRALAVSLVLWDHLTGRFAESHRLALAPLLWIQRYINTPLHIIQDFGWMGVCLFFLVSGFVIMHTAQRHTVFSFMIRRLLKIYPPLLIALPLFALSNASLRPMLHAKTILLNLTLINYFISPQLVLIPVAWTLAVEVLFYTLILLLFPLRKKPVQMILMELLCTLIVLILCRKFGSNFFLFAAVTAYLPYLFTGQIFYCIYRRLVSWPQGIVLLATTVTVMILGLARIHVNFLPLNNSYPISLGFACIIFIVMLLINGRFRLHPLVRYAADISYPLYLVHGSVGTITLLSLYQSIGYWSALGCALIVTVGVSMLMHEYVEIPANKVAAILMRRSSGRER